MWHLVHKAPPPPRDVGSAPPSILSDANGKPAERLSDEEAKALLDEEEARRRARRRNKGRLQELQEIRAELAEREAELLEKEKELLEKEQTVAVLREEVCAVVWRIALHMRSFPVGDRKEAPGAAVKGKGTGSRGGELGDGAVWAARLIAVCHGVATNCCLFHCVASIDT